MNITLKIWRQQNAKAKGRFETYNLDNVSVEMSFLEMLDYLNSTLVEAGKEPVAFESDCREGICGCCGLYINGHPHGKLGKITTCELYMREFKDGDTITVEPWRSGAFPVIKDLIVDRKAFEKIMYAGGFISVNAGAAQDANAIPVNKHHFELAFDPASCIGCGACVAACKNASAMLFVSAKVSHLALLPQGKPEAARRAKQWLQKWTNLDLETVQTLEPARLNVPKVLLLLTSHV